MKKKTEDGSPLQLMFGIKGRRCDLLLIWGGGEGLCVPKEISPLLGATMNLEFHCTKFGILKSNQVFCKLFVYVIRFVPHP